MCRCLHGWPLGAVLLFILADAVHAAGGSGFDPMETFVRVALYLPALLLGIGLHEYAHAYVADRLGDPTPGDDGRLSLNPLDHLDPVGSLVILAALTFGVPLIGWGLPVQVSGAAFRNPIRDMLKVAVAGPMMNLAVAGGASMFLYAFNRFGAPQGLPPHAVERLGILLAGIVLTNLSLAMFNLLPIPPLDGHWVAREFLNSDQVLFMAQIEPFGMPILLALMWSGVLDLPFRGIQLLFGALTTSPAALGGYLVLVAGLWLTLLGTIPGFWRRFRR